MSPQELRDYLAVLPPGATSVDLASGDFKIAIRLTPLAAPATPLQGEVVGDRVPPELAEAFPQLLKAFGA